MTDTNKATANNKESKANNSQHSSNSNTNIETTTTTTTTTTTQTEMSNNDDSTGKTTTAAQSSQQQPRTTNPVTLADIGITPKSVNDSETEKQLRAALVQCTLTNAPCASASWQLHPSTLEAGSVSQSVDEEMARLQVLKSYLVLDSERERRF